MQNIEFSKVEQNIANLLSNLEEKCSLVIDVTDTYFEGETLEDEPRRGKDGKVKKLIQVAIAVTEKEGFPVFHRVFDGNTSSKLMFAEMLSTLAAMGYTGLIVDRGFYSDQNIDDALALKRDIICGVVKDKHFRPFLLQVDKQALYKKENRVTLKNTHVYISSVDYKGGKLIVVYNPYLEVVKRERHYDVGGEEEDAGLLGFSIIFHNTDLADDEVVRKYFGKDVVERAFKQMKGVLSLRPVRVWLRSHVEAHVKVCYVAYAILSLLEFKISSLGISAVDALDILRTGYRVKLCDRESRFEWETTVELKSEQKKIRNVVYKNH